jgi:hypothetical protein
MFQGVRVPLFRGQANIIRCSNVRYVSAKVLAGSFPKSPRTRALDSKALCTPALGEGVGWGVWIRGTFSRLTGELPCANGGHRLGLVRASVLRHYSQSSPSTGRRGQSQQALAERVKLSGMQQTVSGAGGHRSFHQPASSNALFLCCLAWFSRYSIAFTALDLSS